MRNINGLSPSRKDAIAVGAALGSLRSAPVFDPVSALLAAKSSLEPSAVLRPDPAYFKSERFGNRLGGVGVVVYAVVWLLLCQVINGVALNCGVTGR